jgi:septum formation protein
MPTIILASQSPRRRQLLEQIGLRDFQILVPHADESYDPTLSPQDIVCSICRKKALAAQALTEDKNALLIAADTMVFLDGLRLGKPHSEDEARQMLQSLSGRTHQVCTGLTVCQGDHIETEPETTLVTFRPMTDREIDAYIATGDPMDKAGAYGVQGKAALFVSGIQGDYFNVMGLPLHHLGLLLGRFGLDLFSEEVEG